MKDFVHNRGAYINKKCRCEVCKKAHREYTRKWVAKKRLHEKISEK